MAKYSILQSFYASDAWQAFRAMVIAERGMICQHCGQLIAQLYDLTIHHIVELTPENVNDVMISLNPDNVLIVHHDCHNQIHKRFGYGRGTKQVYLVYGAPLSGKTTLVRQQMTRGDLIVDMNELYAAVSLLPSFDKPDGLLTNVMGLYNGLIDNIKTRYGKWNNAWVIGGYPEKFKREKLADALGAELVFCDVTKELCIDRLFNDPERKYRTKEWAAYIEDWFDRYSA